MVQRIKNFLFVNTSTHQTIAKNTFWLFAGQIASRLFRVIIVIYGARILGVDEWGAFAYALGFGTFFTTFIDFGINGVITRESSKDTSKQEKYFATALFIKIVLSISVALFLILLSPYLLTLFIHTKDIGKVLPLIPFIVCIVIFDGIRDFVATLSRAWEKMEIESVVQVVTNSIIVIASFIALLCFSKSAQSLAIGYAIGTGIGMIAAFYPFRRYLINITKKISYDLIKPIIKASWPFGMVGLMGIIMLNTDTIVLGWYRSLETVGYYSAAQKIAQLIQSLPGLIAIAFFPSLARNVKNKEYFKTIIEKATKLLLVIAIPLTFVGIFYSGTIINILYGTEYGPATRTFQILCATFIASFLTAIFANAVFALGQEKKLFSYVIMGVAGNFVFDLIFIPYFGASGAALSTAINFNIVTLYLLYILKRSVSIKILSKIRKIIIATGAMMFLVGIMQLLNISPYISAGVGLLSYGVILWIQKEETLLDIAKIGKIKNSIDTV